VTEGQFIAQLLSALKEQQRDLAESAMLHPKPDLFGHGQTVGRWQGLKDALDTIDAILRDEYEKERNS
jgi:hypothetical protein